jgi:hypothetical protein
VAKLKSFWDTKNSIRVKRFYIESYDEHDDKAAEEHQWPIGKDKIYSERVEAIGYLDMFNQRGCQRRTYAKRNTSLPPFSKGFS